jgi:hypothetical protein
LRNLSNVWKMLLQLKRIRKVIEKVFYEYEIIVNFDLKLCKLTVIVTWYANDKLYYKLLYENHAVESLLGLNKDLKY